MSQLKKIIKTHEMSSFLFPVASIFIVGCINPGSWQPTSILNCSNDGVMFTLLAVGGAFVILTGEIDVSVGTTLDMSAAMGATLLRDDSNRVVTILAALAIGVIIGFINGFGVSILQIPSLIFTLGVDGVVHGLIYVLTKGTWMENPPAEYTRVSNTLVARQLTTFYTVAILVMITGHMILTQTKKGKYFIAMRDNVTRAALVGIPASQTKITAYIISGVFAATAGMIYTSRIGFVAPTTGNSYEMKAIAAYVLGGISLTGGQGSLADASIGAIIMSSISRTLVFLGFSSNYDNIITGTLLITVVVINTVTQNRATLKNRYQILSARTMVDADKKGGVQS